MEEESRTEEIHLYIYDMSKGMAKTFSAMIIGKELPGIWHTAIVAYGREYFYGATGIESCNPGETILGHPDQLLLLGRTELPYAIFLDYILSLGHSEYQGNKYDLFHHNCNNFTNDLAQFLVGTGIPKEIVDLPSEVLNTPLGQLFGQYLGSFNIRPAGVGTNLSDGGLSIEPSHNRSSNHDRSNNLTSPTVADSKDCRKMEATAEPLDVIPKTSNGGETLANGGSDNEEEEVPKTTPRRTYKYDDPPILFPDVDGAAAVKNLTDLVNDQLNEDDQKYLKEWSDYLMTDSGAWIIGDEHLDLIDKFLSGGETFAPNVPLLTLQTLAAAALQEDFVLILHQDRKDHRVMSYINRIESLTLAEQEAIARMLCNMCSQPSSFDWLMYISEWNEKDGQPASNCRVTTRAAVHTVLNDQLTTLQKVGVALIFNLALKELFDDTATELATAVLQFLSGDLDEEMAFRCLTSLARFIACSANDVPMLIKMLGPDLSKFKGKSERVDTLAAAISDKVAAALAGKAGV